MPADPGAGGGVRGLECVVSGSPLLIPVDHVEQIVEYVVSAPPPLAQSWVGGLAVLNGRLVTSLRIGGGEAGPRSTKGLWVERGVSRMGVVVEVDRVGAMITAERTTEPPGQTSYVCPAHWLGVARRAGGGSLLVLEVAAMLADLAPTTPHARGDHALVAG